MVFASRMTLEEQLLQKSDRRADASELHVSRQCAWLEDEVSFKSHE